MVGVTVWVCSIYILVPHFLLKVSCELCTGFVFCLRKIGLPTLHAGLRCRAFVRVGVGMRWD